ncbi:MAG: transposase, partial [Verrucomicrobiota bacterium]|nr:transposase [Verrucomicrobiota bacterium]
MARKARVEFNGAVYHLLERGDRQEAIFRDDLDRERFLATLRQACARTGWRVHAFVLMSNHYHLLVETPEPNLVAGMRWFQSTYTIRFNRRHRLSGHLFQGRYKAIVVDPEERTYLVTLSDYIHLNPVRARLISLQERLFDYRWSSYRYYAAKAGRPEWFEPSRVFGELDLADTISGRRRYGERMRQRAVEEVAGRNLSGNEALQSNWCLGGESFRERMLKLLESAGEKLSGKKEVDGVIRQSHGEEEARRLLQRALAYYGLRQVELVALKRSDPRKVAMAQLIRRRTSVP